MESVDLVVVGTGWNGLVAAKTYLDVNPTANVVVLDAESSIGGVWANHRLCKNLKSNNLLGTYEFSDFPMDETTFGVKSGQYIPGEVVHTYLEKYIEHFGLADKIRLNSKVETAEHRPDGTWRLSIAHPGEDASATTELLTRKLIVATGMTSQPFLPEFEGQGSFEVPLFHYKDLPRYEADLLQEAKRATVFGGTKSGWDVAYACATSGLQVDWIIRESGHGPNWMAPSFVTPLKKWLEKLVTTRFLTWFSPCIWGDADGYAGIRRFLHRTWLGRKIVDTFWGILESDVVDLNGYDRHPETKKLKPWVSPFWVASGLSIFNYPTDVLEYVRNGTIKVHIADVDHLSSKTVHLSTGETLPTDVLICSTGWKSTPPLKFLPEGIEGQLGLPWSPDVLDKDVVKEADEEILNRFPRLRNQPPLNPKYKPMSSTAAAAAPHPFRLTRFMVPPSMINDRSIAFLGMTMTINTALVAQTQALWATAYLGGKLSVTPTIASGPRTGTAMGKEVSREDALEWETALHTEFGKWRYPGGFGRRNPDFVFDAIPYLDLLLGDLGLQMHRKQGRLAEIFDPYGPEDYRGLVEEWKDTQA